MPLQGRINCMRIIDTSKQTVDILIVVDTDNESFSRHLKKLPNCICERLSIPNDNLVRSVLDNGRRFFRRPRLHGDNRLAIVAANLDLFVDPLTVGRIDTSCPSSELLEPRAA